MNIRDLIRARMARLGGGPTHGPSRGPSGPSRRPSSGGRDVEMRARNQRINTPSAAPPAPTGRRPVPGLQGVYFSDDYGDAMRKAAQSSASFHGGGPEEKLRHPAVDFSRNMAGIDGLAGGEIERITGETQGRLAEKGITRDSTGTYRLGQDTPRINARDLSAPSPGLGGFPSLTGSGATGPASRIPVTRPSPQPKSTLGGSIASGVKSAIGIGQTPQSPVSPPAVANIGGGIRGAIESALSQARTPVQRPTPSPTAGTARRVGSNTVVGTAPNTISYPTNPGTYPSVQQVPPAGPRPANAPVGTKAPGDPTVTQLPGANAAPNGRDPVTGQALPPPIVINPTYPSSLPADPNNTGAKPGGPNTGLGSTPTMGGRTITDPAAAPATAPAATGGPTGVVSGEGLMLGNAVGMDWATLAPYNATIEAEAAKWGVDPRILRSVIALESQGNPDAQNPNSSSHGLLQIQPEWHAQGASQLGYTLGTPEGDIGYFAALIAGQAPGQNLHGTPLENAVEIMAGGTAGGSPEYAAAYRNDIEVLMGTQGQAAPAGTSPTAPAGTHIDPATGQPVMIGTTNAAGQPVLVGNADAAAVDPTQARPPAATGSITPMATPVNGQGTAQGQTVTQGDGLGIYAGPDADESWIQDMFPGGTGGVSTDYKQDVCTYNPDCCTGGPDCWYNSNTLMAGASNTVHPGYDVSSPAGTTFHAPMAGEVLGTKYNASDPRCITPDGLNHCSWAADDGIVLDGGVDSQGNQIYINYDHAIPDASLVGQYVDAGTPLGTVNQDNHIHVEIHGWCPSLGKSVVLDPSLVYGGYYQTHSVCEGVA
jgi:hypothetical protein